MILLNYVLSHKEIVLVGLGLLIEVVPVVEPLVSRPLQQGDYLLP